MNYFQDLAYNSQSQIEQLIIQREEMNRKYEHQAKLLAQASQEMSQVELLATQHYTEMLEAQQQKAAAVVFCSGGGFLSVKDAFSETGYAAFYQ